MAINRASPRPTRIPVGSIGGPSAQGLAEGSDKRGTVTNLHAGNAQAGYQADEISYTVDITR